MTLTSSKARQHAGFGPLLPEVYHVPFGYCYRCEFGKQYPSCDLFCVSAIERDLFARQIEPHDVAAIFVEPMQGEGGYVVPPPDYLRALRDLCDKYGILLVCDEIQCGIGRTGTHVRVGARGVEPDILLTAKGLASGMPLGRHHRARIDHALGDRRARIDLRRQPRVLRRRAGDARPGRADLMANARAMGDRLIAGVRQLAERHAAIGDIRGLGLMIGVEFVTDRAIARAGATAGPRPRADGVHPAACSSWAAGAARFVSRRPSSSTPSTSTSGSASSTSASPR